MQAFGLSPDDFSAAPLDVWPCHWQAVQLFIGLSTQWRVGFAGAYGLDYGALAAAMDMQDISPRKRKSLFNKVRLMEQEVLSMWVERENGK